MIDSATKLRESRFHIFDPIGLINDTCIASYDRFSGGSSPLRFAVEAKGGGVDLDASSPRLWKTSPASSPPPETSDSHQPMSPNSRTEAIARGRKELMEMIKDMPESFYELSLRDIVDQNYSQISPPPLADRDFTAADDEKRLPLMADPRKEKKKVKKTMTRSRSVDNGGYLLKTTVFPISFALRRNKKKKQKKKSLFSSGSLKVEPTSATVAAKSAEKEWWRRKSSEESESSVGLSSSNSGSSSSSTSRSSSSSSRQGQNSRFLPGCCSFRNN